MANRINIFIHLLLVSACLMVIADHPARSEDKQKAFGRKSDERRLAAATANFGIEFLRKLEANKNVIFSPLSLQIALSMVLLGAGKNSSSDQQLSKVLGYDFTRLIKSNGSDTSRAHRAMLSLTQSLKALDGKSDDDELSLKLANLVLSDKDQVKLKQTYKTALTSYYDVKLEEFSSKEGEAPLVERINSWIKKNTGNKIDKVIKSDDLKDIVVVLLNAAHFKDSWLQQFSPKLTRERDFFNQGLASKKKKVQFMSQEGSFGYSNLKPGDKSCIAEAGVAACKLDCEMLSMPFKANNGSELSMVILLPHKRDGIANLQAKLVGHKFNVLYKTLTKQSLGISIPKFKFEAKVEAKGILQKMGLIDVFDERANFDQMIEASHQKRLYVDKVIHKAMVAVDETGAEAAAVTVVTMTHYSMGGDSFVADHPFLFIIRHDKSDMPLFMGRVDELN